MAPKKSPSKAQKAPAPAVDLKAEMRKAADGGYYLKVSKKLDGEWSFKHNFITGHTGKWSDNPAGANSKQDATFVYLPEYRLAGSLADIREFAAARGINFRQVFDKNSKNDTEFLAEVAAQKSRAASKSSSQEVKTANLNNLIKMAQAYTENKASFITKDEKSPKKSPSKSSVSDSQKFSDHVKETLSKGKWLNISALTTKGTGSKATDKPTEKYSTLDAPFDRVFWSTGTRAVKAGKVTEGRDHAKKLLRDAGQEVSSPRAGTPKSPPKVASPRAVSPRVASPKAPSPVVAPRAPSPKAAPVFAPVSLPTLPGVKANPFAAAPMPSFKPPTFAKK